MYDVRANCGVRTRIMHDDNENTKQRNIVLNLGVLLPES